MFAPQLLAAGLFAVSTLAAPSVSPAATNSTVQYESYRTLSYFRRVCHGYDCHYSFNIDEDGHFTPGFKDEDFPLGCLFSISGRDLRLPGNRTSFERASCYRPNDSDDEPFRARGVWHPSGWMSITVFKVVKPGIWSKVIPGWPKGPTTYFSTYRYDDVDMLQDKVEEQTSRVYRVVGPDHDGKGAPPPMVARNETESKNGDGYWQIKNINRYYKASVKVTVIWFDIVFADGQEERCHMSFLNSTLDMNFSSKRCDGDVPLTVSWGYKTDTDGVVMTVCSPSTQEYAVFGWDHIGEHESIPDSEKMPVRTGCC